MNRLKYDWNSVRFLHSPSNPWTGADAFAFAKRVEEIAALEAAKRDARIATLEAQVASLQMSAPRGIPQ